MRQSTPAIAILLIAFLLVPSCQHSGGNPLVPTIGNHPIQAVDRTPSRVLFGLWTVDISADHSSMTVSPDRTLDMHLNATRLLEKTACTNCLSISNVHVLPNNELSADLTIKHPFPGKDQYTAFDVRGILVSDADYTFPVSGRKVAWGDNLLKLLNADGYTPLFNPTEFPESGPGPALFKYITGKYSMGTGFTSTLNPYLGYSEDQPRRIFTAGTSQTRKVLLHVPAGALKFGYAVDGCWVPVASVTDPLVDFPTTANCNEAYQIKANAGLILPGTGNSAQVQVEVFDHQGIDTISSVTIEAPDLFSSEISLAFSTATGDESYLFSGLVSNEKGVDIGNYPLLVKVSDNQSDPNSGLWMLGKSPRSGSGLKTVG